MPRRNLLQVQDWPMHNHGFTTVAAFATGGTS